MKKLLSGMVLALTVVSCIPSSVIRGSGKEAKGAFDISLNYTELVVSSGIVVELVDSDKGEGFITADEAVLEYVSIVEEGGRVKVSYEPFVSVHTDIETHVTMPVSASLTRLDASSAAKITGLARVVCSNLEVDCSSAARVELAIETGTLLLDLSSAAHFNGNVSVGDLTVDATSASDCTVEGNADHAGIEVSSAAGFKGFDLMCGRADADASSGGFIEVTVTEELNAQASSGGNVRYQGAPTIVRRDTSSGGTIREVL